MLVNIDRDGVINHNNRSISGGPYYVLSLKQFEWIPGSKEAIVRLQKAGFTIHIVTSQKCITKNLTTIEDIDKIHDYMMQSIIEEGGKDIDVSVVVSEDVATSKAEAIMDHPEYKAGDICWMIGDSKEDIIAGKLAGCRTIFIVPENVPDSERHLNLADYYADSLLAATSIVLKESTPTENIDIQDLICKACLEHIGVINLILDGGTSDIVKLCCLAASVIKAGGKIILFGNGGSAADAQHIAAEFVNVLEKHNKRPALNAIALTTNTSIITSIANDFSYNDIFSRQIEAIGVKGDLAIGISTSGTSENVIRGLLKAKEMGLYTTILTGDSKTVSTDLAVCVSSKNTPRIQEAHVLIGHILCSVIEKMGVC